MKQLYSLPLKRLLIIRDLLEFSCSSEEMAVNWRKNSIIFVDDQDFRSTISSNVKSLRKSMTSVIKAIKIGRAELESVRLLVNGREEQHRLIERTIESIRSELDRIKEWQKEAAFTIDSSARNAEDIERIEKKIDLLGESVFKLDKVIDQVTFSSEKIEIELQNIDKDRIELEKELEKEMIYLKTFLNEEYISKKDFLTQQKNLLWGVIGFVSTTLFGWFLSKL